MLAIKDYERIKNYGEKLSREGVALRILELCRECAESDNYKKAIEISGRIYVLALACKFDSYWEEKRDIGIWKEMDDLAVLLKGEK